MRDVTRRTFNGGVIGAAVAAAAGTPSAARACVSLQGVSGAGLATPYDDELKRMRRLMAEIEDAADRLRYLETGQDVARSGLLAELRDTTDGAAATLDRMRVQLDAELAQQAAAGNPS